MEPRLGQRQSVDPDQLVEPVGEVAGRVVHKQRLAHLPMLHHIVQDRLEHRAQRPFLLGLGHVGIDERLGLGQHVRLHALQQRGGVRIVQVKGAPVEIHALRDVPHRDLRKPLLPHELQQPFL